MSKIRTPTPTTSEVKYPLRCWVCRKKPRNCICFEYRIESEGLHWKALVYVDNVCMEPVKGEAVRTWQARRNARIWSRPKMIDGFGPVLYIRLGPNAIELQEKIRKEIEEKTFHLDNWREVEGVSVRKFEKEMKKLPFLRKQKEKK